MASRAHAINVGGVDVVGAASVATTGELTIVGHGLADGAMVMVSALSGGADGPLVPGAVYFVRDADVDTFRLSGSKGGTRLAFPSTGSATVSVAVPGYNAEELRQIWSHFMYHGAANALGARPGVRPGGAPVISISGPNWVVRAHTGVVDPAVSTTQGPYTYVQLGAQGPWTAAHATLDRIDALDLQIQDTDVDSEGFRRTVIVYAAGTPAGSPTPPTLTARSARLGTIRVFSVADGSAPAVVTDAQPTVANGGVLPVAGVSQLPTVGLYAGMVAYRQDVSAMVVYNGSTWDFVNPLNTPSVVGTSNGNFDFTNTSFGVSFSAGTYADCAAVFTAPLTGKVEINWSAGFYRQGAAASGNAHARICPEVRAGGTVGSGTIIMAASTNRSARANQFNSDNSSMAWSQELILTGLTPGNVYNARLLHLTTSGTSTAFDRQIRVKLVT